MILPKANTVLLALLALAGARSGARAFAEDPARAPVPAAPGLGGGAGPDVEGGRGPGRRLEDYRSDSCLNVAGSEDGLTHNYCFEGCEAHQVSNRVPHTKVPNLATFDTNPHKDEEVELLGTLAQSWCDSEGMNLVRYDDPNTNSESRAVIRHDTTFGESELTVAMVVKHHPFTGQFGREFFQGGRFVINSEPYPKMRVSLSGTGEARIYDDFYSKSEFVSLVTTVSNTKIVTYKNGVNIPVTIHTPNDSNHWEPIDTSLGQIGKLTFSVKASNDAHIALGSSEFDYSSRVVQNHYEIVLGGWANTKSVMRTTTGSSSGAESDEFSGTILSSSDFRTFQILWTQSTLSVNRLENDELEHIMSMDISDANYVIDRALVMTGYGASGKWITNRDIDGPAQPGPSDGVTIFGIQNFRGIIKSVAIWNRALSAEEVAGLGMPTTYRSDSCINVAGSGDDLTHDYCFEGCDAYQISNQVPHTKVPNLASFDSNPHKDEEVELQGTTEQSYCNSEGMNLVDYDDSTSNKESRAEIKHDTAFGESELTVAMVVKHDSKTGRFGREFIQPGGLVFNSEQYPQMRISFSGVARKYDDFYSNEEFVSLVTTISNTKLVTYKNGVPLAANNWDGDDNDKLPGLITNTILGIQNFRGIIKSLAIWTRALSAEEVAGLGMPAPPTREPTKKPIPPPTREPTPKPTFLPTREPTKTPTPPPTRKPTPSPTREPTPSPTREPTPSPTREPTPKPTFLPTREPTKTPTPLPTREPTPPPTSPPTLEPTKKPTSTPTRATSPPPPTAPDTAWDIAFVNMTADFSAQAGDEIIAEYEVSKDRAHEVSLFASRCDAAEADREDVTPGVVEAVATSSDKNATHDALAVTYDLNKTLVGSSNVWNETSGSIEFCQRLSLVLGNMTIAEDVREFSVNLTLDADFEFTSGLDPETVEEADESASLEGFLNAFKCDGGSFNEDTSPLSPNDYLFVCIETVQDGVDIESLESMVISQAGITTFQAIDDGAALYPSLTSKTYAKDDEVWVSTRLPLNSFDFQATDASISVSGNAVLKFVSESGRRLQGDVGAGVVDGPARESEFDLEVKLTAAGAYAKSPAERVSGAVLPALGAVFAAAFSIW